VGSDRPIACSLSATDLSARLAEMKRLGGDALLSADGEGTLRFRGDMATRARLEAIVAAEADCCPFLDMHLREEAGALVLEIRAAQEAAPVVAELVSAFE
jgi:MerR family transcriptional regulator, copper efflux regulator